MSKKSMNQAYVVKLEEKLCHYQDWILFSN